DADGNQVAILEPLVVDGKDGTSVRPVIHQEFDAAGNRTALVDANGQRTEFHYDGLDRPTLTLYADGTSTKTIFDPEGNSYETVDQAGLIRSYTYDLADRLVAVTLPPPKPGDAPLVTTYTYDELGEQLTQTDTLGHTTQFT